MNRATFLRRLALTAAGLYVAPELILEPRRKIWPGASFGPVLYGDGLHDDTAAMQAYVNGAEVYGPDGILVGNTLFGGTYRITDSIIVNKTGTIRGIRNSMFRGEGMTQKPLFHFPVRSDPYPYFNFSLASG